MGWAPDYVTRTAVKAYLEITKDIHDDLIDEDIAAASRAVDDHCSGAIRRQFGNTDGALVERTYTLTRTRRGAVAEIDDLQDLTGLVVQADGQVVTDYELEPVNALADGKPYEWIVLPSAYAACQLTMLAPWGWLAFPAPATLATKIQSARFHKRRWAPFGIAGSPDSPATGGGNELRLLSRVDPDVAVILRGLRREGAVG